MDCSSGKRGLGTYRALVAVQCPFRKRQQEQRPTVSRLCPKHLQPCKKSSKAKSRAGSTYTRRKEARRKRSEAVSRETACQVLLSFTSEETNEPAEIETVGSRIVETGTMTETLGKDTETMTDLSMSDMQYLDALEKECNHLRSENVELKKSISIKFPCEETLDGDDEQVKFYTGLPTFVTLMAIFRFVSSHFGSSDTSRSLPHFQQFMYICMLP